MKCPKCGNDNADNAKFCKSCGENLNDLTEVKTKNNQKKLIIVLIAIVVILLAGVIAYATGIIHTGPELETKEFDGFKLDVPVESNFVLSDSHTTDRKNIFVGYINDGKYLEDVFGFQVGNNVSTKTIKKIAKLEETDGDLKVYKNESSDETAYIVFKKGDEANIAVYGYNLDVSKQMARSFKDKDFSKLYEKPNKSKSVSQNSEPAQTTSPTASALSILGGSFSTGSDLSDKTYASIYVGPEHSGENVQIQIWYSRDGSTLNHGNMVPKTVDSSGYIEVASADPYSKYPDFAEVNIYDTSGNLLDTRSVSLTPDSGTQTF